MRESVTIDEAYQESIGEFGIGQQWVWLLTSFVWAVASIQVFLMVFVEMDPFKELGLVCTTADCPSWLVDGSKDADEVAEGVCTISRESWDWKESRTHSIVSDFELICEDSWKVWFSKSMFFVGVLCGAGIFGYFSDKYGRRKMLYLATGIAGVFTLLSSLAPSYWYYCVFNLLIGVGFGGEGLAAFVLMTELIGPAWRGKAGIATQFLFALGECLIALLAFLIHPWRQLTMAVAILTFSFFFTWPSVPESPKWLLVNGRKGEASSVLAALASANRTKLPEAPLTDLSGMSSTEKAMSDVVMHPKLRRWLMVTLYTWCVVSCIYYGISLGLDSLPGSIYMKFFLTSLVEFPSYIFIIFLIDKVGRKPIYLWGFVVGSIACMLVTIMPDGGQLLLAMVGKFAVAGVFNLAFLYTTEMFPTIVRNAALGACSLAGRIGGIVASPIVSAGAAMGFDAFPFLIFGLTGLVAGAYCAVLPETLGRASPDTIEDVDHGPAREHPSAKWVKPGWWLRWRGTGKEYSKLDDSVRTRGHGDEENLDAPMSE